MDPNTPLQPYVPPAGNQPLPQQPVQGGPAFGQPPQQMYQPPPMPPQQGNYAAPPMSTAPPAGNFPVAPTYTPPPAPGAFNTPPPPPATGPADPKTEVIERLRQANNVLVTVSNNPSVDQLSAAIATTLMLNKLDKHATAVFSGDVPSTLEFLQPEKTIEKNTDSLRDFIIALDKSKADKLRYKVEDKFVKIFITPYHTSLSDDDLEFSQGDFNVDVVLALGVHRREELDQAITAHGRILHDAAVACINNKQTADLGTMNWFDPAASSLCEMLVSLIEPLQGKKALLDQQIATAFLTGVVAETERFSNDKTTPLTMNISATLMKAGANQQLVASKLQEPVAIPQTADKTEAPVPAVAKSGDGSLAIEHKKEEKDSAAETKTLDDLEKANAETDTEDSGSNLDRIHIDDDGQLQRIAELEEKAKEEKKPAAPPTSSNMVLQPPTLGSALSANTVPETSPPPVDPLSASTATAPEPTGMQHGKPIQPLSAEEKTQTLEQIEQAVDSPHIAAGSQETSADEARAQVNAAQSQIEPEKPEPIAALNAQPVDLGDKPTAPTDSSSAFPTQLVPPDPGVPPDPTAGSSSPSAPPPVPPPLIPPDAE